MPCNLCYIVVQYFGIYGGILNDAVEVECIFQRTTAVAVAAWGV